jgi:hypothetical protein
MSFPFVELVKEIGKYRMTSSQILRNYTGVKESEEFSNLNP